MHEPYSGKHWFQPSNFSGEDLVLPDPTLSVNTSGVHRLRFREHSVATNEVFVRLWNAFYIWLLALKVKDNGLDINRHG
ncbi:hypothetical protein RRG08_051847 [Elysia crispata]|uniref:Uncharacterized protein n=1 Tax=Elysia crispata TaxID=231223 RepID=A0AAE1DDB5_9GAST|nr:hypothetical protein RRG08_051847 [Elysia crispata]